MIHIGTCNLHVAHNNFCKSLEAYCLLVGDLAVGIFFLHDLISKKGRFQVYSVKGRSRHIHFLKACSITVADLCRLTDLLNSGSLFRNISQVLLTKTLNLPKKVALKRS